MRVIDNGFNVGADLRVCPGKNNGITDKGEHTGSPLRKNNIRASTRDANTKINKKGKHIGSPLHRVIQWFKTMTTNEYIVEVKQNGWACFNGKLWQRNYYEHIIRKEEELYRTREYIANNPLNWETDENYKESVKYPEPKDNIADVEEIENKITSGLNSLIKRVE